MFIICRDKKGINLQFEKFPTLIIQAYAQENGGKIINFQNPSGSNLFHHISSYIINWGTMLEVNNEQAAVLYCQHEFLEIFFEGKYFRKDY